MMTIYSLWSLIVLEESFYMLLQICPYFEEGNLNSFIHYFFLSAGGHMIFDVHFVIFFKL